jgi:hypothetical protein
LILGAGGDICFGQGSQELIELLLAGQVRWQHRDVPAIAAQPAAVTLLGFEREVFASNDLGEPGDSLVGIHDRDYIK